MGDENKLDLDGAIEADKAQAARSSGSNAAAGTSSSQSKPRPEEHIENESEEQKVNVDASAEKRGSAQVGSASRNHLSVPGKGSRSPRDLSVSEADDADVEDDTDFPVSPDGSPQRKVVAVDGAKIDHLELEFNAVSDVDDTAIPSVPGSRGGNRAVEKANLDKVEEVLFEEAMLFAETAGKDAAASGSEMDPPNAHPEESEEEEKEMKERDEEKFVREESMADNDEEYDNEEEEEEESGVIEVTSPPVKVQSDDEFPLEQVDPVSLEDAEADFAAELKLQEDVEEDEREEERRISFDAAEEHMDDHIDNLALADEQLEELIAPDHETPGRPDDDEPPRSPSPSPSSSSSSDNEKDVEVEEEEKEEDDDEVSPVVDGPPPSQVAVHREKRPSEIETRLREQFQELRVRAEAGDHLAQRELGDTYSTGKAAVRVEMDEEEAFRWWKEAAENGDSESMVRIGVVLRGRDDDSGASAEEAFEWFEAAAVLGNREALYYTGLMNLIGQGVSEPRMERGVEELTRSAQLGYISAMIAVSKAYVSGMGVEADPEEGRRWLIKAATAGSGDALVDLATAMLDETDLPKHEYTDAVAFACLKLASERSVSDIDSVLSQLKEVQGVLEETDSGKLSLGLFLASRLKSMMEEQVQEALKQSAKNDILDALREAREAGDMSSREHSVSVVESDGALPPGFGPVAEQGGDAGLLGVKNLVEAEADSYVWDAIIEMWRDHLLNDPLNSENRAALESLGIMVGDDGAIGGQSF